MFMDYSDISNREFSRVRKNGLNEEEVRDYLSDLAEQIEELKKQNNSLKKENEEYRQRENSLAKVLISAQENAQKLISDAETESDNIISGAKKEAEAAVKNAEDEAKTIREDIEKEVNAENVKLKKLKEIEKQIRTKIVASLKESIKSFDEEFPTEELWKEADIQEEETTLFSEADESIDLSQIYKDLPKTEDELMNLIKTL